MRDQGSGVRMVTRPTPGELLLVTILMLLIAPLPACHVEREQASADLQPALAEPQNVGFESSYTTHVAYWWDLSGGPYVTEFGEVNAPLYWVADWYEGYQCPGTPYWSMGRPEVGLITNYVDGTRVRSGEQALKLFTFHRCHTAGVHQRFVTVPGQWYRLKAYGQAWYSNCSSKPHYTECALDWDCESCVGVDHELRVGLDPTGGVDPYSPAVIWSEPHTIYGEYAEGITVLARATGEVMTAHFFGRAPLPMRHNDDYWDDITIEAVDLYYWPIVLKEW
jgi:hypothetical protein